MISHRRVRDSRRCDITWSSKSWQCTHHACALFSHALLVAFKGGNFRPHTRRSQQPEPRIISQWPNKRHLKDESYKNGVRLLHYLSLDIIIARPNLALHKMFNWRSLDQYECDLMSSCLASHPLILSDILYQSCRLFSCAFESLNFSWFQLISAALWPSSVVKKKAIYFRAKESRHWCFQS